MNIDLFPDLILTIYKVDSGLQTSIYQLSTNEYGTRGISNYYFAMHSKDKEELLKDLEFKKQQYIKAFDKAISEINNLNIDNL